MSTSADVHEAHTALASCAADDDRIWHRAALAVAPDAALADELEHAARRDLRRGALHAALRAVDASTTFEPTMRQRQHRQLDALEMAIRSNSPIAELDQRIAKLEREPLGDAVLDRFELVRGLLAHRLRHPLVPALDRLERAATVSASRGSVLAVSMLADASYLSLIAGDCPRADRLAGEALALLESHPPDADRSAPALAARAMAAACRGRPDEAGARLAALAPLVGEISPDGTAVIAVPLAMLGLGVLGEHQQTHLLASAAADSARRSGALSALPSLCHAVGEASFRLGNWDAAEVESAEAVRLSQEFDQSGILVHAQAAYGRLLTHRGRFREADALLADAERAARHAGANTLLAVVGHARASRLIATGRFDEAVIALERVLVDVVRPSGMLEPSWVPALPDLVEALVMAGRVADARQVADELGDRASAYPRASVQALVARSRALVATTGSADWFVEAIELHDKEPAAHERARTALLAGEFAIAAGRQADAREHLHQASNQFALLGAEPWLARTEAALRRAGSRAAPRTSRSTELTDAERRVADAVATGLTNREISALLFVSVKTVEFHLSRVYAKLGLRGRAALARHVLTNGDR
jgi:DNA-binding CsgD family transcriptional regulator